MQVNLPAADHRARFFCLAGPRIGRKCDWPALDAVSGETMGMEAVKLSNSGQDKSVLKSKPLPELFQIATADRQGPAAPGADFGTPLFLQINRLDPIWINQKLPVAMQQ